MKTPTPEARVHNPGRRRLQRRALAWTLTPWLAPVALCAWSPAARALASGETAPDVVLPGQPGPLNLAALRGKLVYLDFWASWCGPCRKSFPWMNDLQARLGPRGLQVVGINLDARREDAERFLAQTPAQFALAFDPKGDTPRRYGIKGMPSSVLIGADGVVLLAHSGFRDEDRAVLEQRLLAALPR